MVALNIILILQVSKKVKLVTFHFVFTVVVQYGGNIFVQCVVQVHINTFYWLDIIQWDDTTYVLGIIEVYNIISCIKFGYLYSFTWYIVRYCPRPLWQCTYNWQAIKLNLYRRPVISHIWLHGHRKHSHTVYGWPVVMIEFKDTLQSTGVDCTITAMVTLSIIQASI